MHSAVVAYNKKERAINAHIDSGNVFKIDPWVEYTRWHNYLNTLKVESLLALINKPNLNNELTLAAIWNAIAELYYIYNEIIALKAGIFI